MVISRVFVNNPVSAEYLNRAQQSLANSQEGILLRVTFWNIAAKCSLTAILAILRVTFNHSFYKQNKQLCFAPPPSNRDLWLLSLRSGNWWKVRLAIIFGSRPRFKSFGWVICGAFAVCRLCRTLSVGGRSGLVFIHWMQWAGIPLLLPKCFALKTKGSLIQSRTDFPRHDCVHLFAFTCLTNVPSTTTKTDGHSKGCAINFESFVGCAFNEVAWASPVLINTSENCVCLRARDFFHNWGEGGGGETNNEWKTKELWIIDIVLGWVESATVGHFFFIYSSCFHTCNLGV